MNSVVLHIPQVAERLGLTTTAARHLIERGVIPSRKLGGRVVVLAAEFDSFVASLPRRGEVG